MFELGVPRKPVILCKMYFIPRILVLKPDSTKQEEQGTQPAPGNLISLLDISNTTKVLVSNAKKPRHYISQNMAIFL